MKVAIGLRTTPKEVHYAIVENEDQYILKSIESIKIPQALGFPEQLRYVRQNLLDIIGLYKIEYAVLRIAEALPMQRPDSNRLMIEGVLQETIAGSTINAYAICRMVTISARLGIKPSDFKEYTDGSLIFENIPDWNKYSKEKREALLSCFSAFNIN